MYFILNTMGPFDYDARDQFKTWASMTEMLRKRLLSGFECHFSLMTSFALGAALCGIYFATFSATMSAKVRLSVSLSLKKLVFIALLAL